MSTNDKTAISCLVSAHQSPPDCLWTVRPDELAALAPIDRIKAAMGDKSFGQWLLDLIEAARQASANTFCDYSHYGLGSSVLAFDGEKLSIYSGANYENCAYTPTKHAEEAAVIGALNDGCLRRARAKGLKKTEWLIALACYDPQDLLNPVPCCICRQYLVEFGQDLIIVGPGPQEGFVNATTLKVITPKAFVPDMVVPFLPKGI